MSLSKNQPLTKEELLDKHKPRESLKESQFPINIKTPLIPPKPGVRIFPPLLEEHYC